MNVLSKKPVGSSAGFRWCNTDRGTTNAVTCEICGTNHPELDESDESYALAEFLGKQAVLDCCGKIIDLAYSEMGERFAIAFLEEFSREPTNVRFAIFRMALMDCLPMARNNAAQIVTEMQEHEKNMSSK